MWVADDRSWRCLMLFRTFGKGMISPWRQWVENNHLAARFDTS